jgi:hypothetical protein
MMPDLKADGLELSVRCRTKFQIAEHLASANIETVRALSLPDSARRPCRPSFTDAPGGVFFHNRQLVALGWRLDSLSAGDVRGGSNADVSREVA